MGEGLQGLRIGLLTASASRLNGGVFEAVVAHAEMIRAAGGTPVVIALDDAYAREDQHRFGPCEVIHCPIKGPPQIGYAPDMVKRLIEADLDLLHLHGIWMYPSSAGAAWARRMGRPYYVSPHGMLDPWITARGRWKKAIARAGYERRSWRAAYRLHALTMREAGDIARESGRGDALVIPNAGPDVFGAVDRPRENRIAYIGRIHAKKNLLPLVEAWAQARRPDGARLDIAGWGAPEDVAALEQAVAAAGESVRFLGPVYGQAKQDLLAGARFAVLPSLSEGLPMAVVEAWAACTPVIMTRECNLDEGFPVGAALECGYDAAAIRPVIEKALAMEDGRWAGMARAAETLARGPFSAMAVRTQWAKAYRAAVSKEAAQ